MSRDLELGGVSAVSPCRKNVFPISMKFGMYIQVDECCMTVCRMTRFKVKVEVTALVLVFVSRDLELGAVPAVSPPTTKLF